LPVFSYEPNQHLTSININSFGFRGEEFSLQKDSNTYRIFMVGGSTTFGAGATSDEKTIPAQLEKIFLENGYQIEIINAGVGAADSREEAYKIRESYKRFQPDMFIIYDGWNDSFRNLEKTELNLEISRYESLDSKKSDLHKWIRDNLDVYRTIPVIYPIIYHYQIASSMNDNVYLENAEIWSQRWSNICLENNQKNIDTIILLQPVVGSGEKSLSYDEKRHAEYIKAIKTNEQLEFFSNQLPIEFCTASFDMRNAIDRETEPVYYDGGHMNDLGNKIMANAIYEKIEPIIKNELAYLN
jgi:lysophospholipase L1-like esterase